ncbi:MAG: hypothetical protein Q4A75_05680 [Peptostreptococcaceae bacterium]|nr:hypothetical protein [Peptostreptococcaceae bacterium]
MDRWNKIGSRSTIIGLGMLALIFLFDLSYPSIGFQVLAPLALLMIFLGLLFFAAGWLLDLITQLRSGHYWVALAIFVAGVLIILRSFW